MKQVFSKLALMMAIFSSVPNADAETILVFGQSGTADNFHAKNNGQTGAAGGTTLSAVDIKVIITAIDSNTVSAPLLAYFDLDAVSKSNAYLDQTGHVNQDFDGHFSLTSQAGHSGVNYLSGTFTHNGGGGGASVLGAGNSLTLSASSPGGVTVFTSDVITDLLPAWGISFAFTDVHQQAFITALHTIRAFDSNVAGNFSATVPEPSSFALLGLGGIGIAIEAYRRRRCKADADRGV